MGNVSKVCQPGYKSVLTVLYGNTVERVGYNVRLLVQDFAEQVVAHSHEQWRMLLYGTTDAAGINR